MSKELYDDELEKATGGKSGFGEQDDAEYMQYRAVCQKEIGKYDTADYIGKNCLVLNAWVQGRSSIKHYGWYYGTILKSYERSIDCGRTTRSIDINCLASGGENARVGNTTIGLGDNYTVYVEN